MLAAIVVAGYLWWPRPDANDNGSRAPQTGSSAPASRTPEGESGQHPETDTESPVAEASFAPVPSLFGGVLRNGYDPGKPPKALRLRWRIRLGSGPTQRKVDNKIVIWSGSGWTGQPTVARDGDKTWLFLGAYDHSLRKLDAESGKTAWRSIWPDVMKGTNTVVPNPAAPGDASEAIVVSGSRRGSEYSVTDSRIAPLRAVSFETGEELWRLPVPPTKSYTRDVDSSPLWYGGVLYAPVESGYVFALDPFKTRTVGDHREPVVIGRSPRLFTDADAAAHPDVGGANVAIEGSPAAIGDVIYITSGAGHIYGLDRRTLKVVWDFKTGSDIDATPVVTEDKCLLVTIEKEYIKEPGGVYKLDPSKPPSQSVVWYYPLPTRSFAEWKGGSVGSVAVNDVTNDGSQPRLAAFTSVSGSVHVIAQEAMTGKRSDGPGPGDAAPVPREVFSANIGSSISTPVFADGTLVVAGYDRRVRLYRFTFTEAEKGDEGALPCPDGRFRTVKTTLVDTYEAGGSIESVPLVWQGRVYIGSRDGYLYCLE